MWILGFHLTAILLAWTLPIIVYGGWPALVAAAFPATALFVTIRSLVRELRENAKEPVQVAKNTTSALSEINKIALLLELLTGASVAKFVRIAIDQACNERQQPHMALAYASLIYVLFAIFASYNRNDETPPAPRFVSTLVLPAIFAMLTGLYSKHQLTSAFQCIAMHPPHSERDFSNWRQLHAVESKPPLLVSTDRHNEANLKALTGYTFNSERFRSATLLSSEEPLLVLGRCTAAELEKLGPITRTLGNSIVVQDYGDMRDAPPCPTLTDGWWIADAATGVLANGTFVEVLPQWAVNDPTLTRGTFVSSSTAYANRHVLIVCEDNQAVMVNRYWTAETKPMPRMDCLPDDYVIIPRSTAVIERLKKRLIVQTSERAVCSPADFSQIVAWMDADDVAITRQPHAKSDSCYYLKSK